MKFVCWSIVLVILFGSCEREIPGWKDIPLPADRTAVFPFLTQGNDGLLLSWIETVSDTVDILKVAQGDSAGFYGVTEVARGSDWFVNWADFPKMSQFAGGKYIVHWLQKSTTSTYDYNIHVAIGDFGTRQPDTTFILHDDGVNAEHGFVSFMPYGESMLAVWLDGRNTKNADGTYGQMTLRSVILDDQGNKSLPQEIDDRVCDCCQTDLAMIGGQPVVVYRDRAQDEIRDNYYAIFDGNTWSEGKPVFDDGWKIPGCPVNGPAIAGGSESGAVAWYTEVDQRGMVRLATFSAQEMAFSEPLLELDDVMGRVDIKNTGNGDFLYVWLEKNMEEGLLKINKLNTEKNTTKNPKIVGTMHPSRDSGFPSINELSGIKMKAIGLHNF